MSEDTKKKESELEDKDLDQVAGGVDIASPLHVAKSGIESSAFVPDKTIT